MLFSSVAIVANEQFETQRIYLDKAGDLSVEKFTRHVLEKAYSELDIDVQYRSVPLARSYREANAGRLDGLRGRVGTVANTYSNLVKIDLPLVTFNVILIVDKNACRQVTNDKSKECDISQLSNVGTVRGFKALEDYRKTNPLPFDVLELVSKEQTLDMLSANKLQAAILTESLVAQDLFEKHPQWGTYLLTTVGLYHYLNKKHELLIDELTRKLEELESKGWLDAQRSHFNMKVKILVNSLQ